MLSDSDPSPIRQVLSENQRLRQRVFELEEKVRKLSPPAEGQSGSGSSVLKLIEHKDFQLEQCTARLEEKKEQLQEASRELEGLRFYRDILENDPTPTIGVNRDGVVVLYNRGASQLLGEKLKESLQKPIESVDFHGDPETAKRVRQALASRRKVDSTLETPEARIMTRVEPIGSESELLGGLLRITAISRK